MTLGDVKRLDAVSQLVWRNETENYLAGSISETLEGQARDVDISIDLTSQDLLLEDNQSLRRLQASGLQLTFNAVLSIISSIEEPDFNGYILIAFEGENEENAYMALLKATGDPAFTDIISVSVSPATSVTSITTPGDGERHDIAMIVGVVLGSLAIIGFAGFFVYRRRRVRSKLPLPTPQSTGEDGNCPGEDGSCPYGNEIAVGPRGDISTLGDPIPPHLRNDLVADDPTRSTTGTLTEYDFQKAYRSGQSSVVDTINTGSDPSSFVCKDDMTLEAVYSLPTENRFEVEAPAVSLGFVLETFDEGVLVVHSIRETSCLALEVHAGDHLLAVDGEDVSKMEASFVSRLIASKKDNPVRRFVFTRPEVQ